MKLVLILLIIASGSFVSHAQNREHASIHYGVEQGLPTTEIYWVIEDCIGNIWFGTDAGISKFDGYEFKNFTTKDGLTDHTIFHLYEDPLERIWFLPFNSALGYIKNDSVYTYPYNKKIKSAIEKGLWISKILVDKDDNLKFILVNGTAGSVSSSGELTLENETVNGTNLLVEDKFNKTNYLYLLRNKKAKDTTWTYKHHKTISDYKFNFQNSGYFYEHRITNDIVLFSYHLTVGFKNKGTFKTFNFGKKTLGITLNSKGNLWIQVYGEGVFVYKSITAFLNSEKPLYQLFEGQDISCVLHGKNGEVWVCTNKQGVYYFQNEFITIYSQDKKNNGNKITSLFMDEKGVFFYANGNGEIYKMEMGETPQKIINNAGYITQFSIAEKNKITISAFIKKHRLQTLNAGINNTIFIGRKFLKTTDGFWKIVQSGVQKIENEQIVFNSETIMGNNFFHSIFEDDKKQIWLGGNEGLFLFKDNKLIPINAPFNNDIKVKCINQLNNGTMLIATASRGLYLLQKNENGYKTINIELSGYNLKDIHIDQEKNIWLATNKGVVIISKVQQNKYFIRTISHLHGLPSDEINAVITSNNKVYVATNKGLAVLDRSRLNKNKNKIFLRIENIKVNEKKIKKDSVYTFKHFENYIEFFYTGIHYKNPGKVLYAYKLDGIDTKWHHTKSRIVRYASLAPNTYKFSIKAANEDAVWSDPIQIKFTINPPFWKENMFIINCLILFALLGYITHKKLKKNRQKKHENLQKLEKQKRKIIELELKALRAQMNPHFTFNTLNSIQSFITNFDREKANRYISEFSLLLRKVLEMSQYTTITIEEEVEMLTLYLNLENLRFKNSINYKISVDPNLDSCFQEIPSMIIQPFVENAIIHGFAGKKDGEKELIIALTQKENDILCIIQDSGVGRKKAAKNKQRKMLKHESLGVKITTERLQYYNKEKATQLSFSIIDLKDANGEACGTRVEIIFKKNTD